MVYLTATDMFDILSESRFGGRDGEEVRDRAAYILDCDLLIIDDLGTELINTFTASQLFYCINERLTKKLGTIISTNLALSRMQDEFTERVTSRIMSQYKVLPLLGEDLRLRGAVMGNKVDETADFVIKCSSAQKNGGKICFTKKNR